MAVRLVNGERMRCLECGELLKPGNVEVLPNLRCCDADEHDRFGCRWYSTRLREDPLCFLRGPE